MPIVRRKPSTNPITPVLDMGIPIVSENPSPDPSVKTSTAKAETGKGKAKKDSKDQGVVSKTPQPKDERKPPLLEVKRVYRTPIGMRASVTSIIEATSTDKEKKSLQSWIDKEKAEGRDPHAARERGTEVHRLREKYLREGIIEYVSNEVDDLFIPLTYFYDKFQDALWCEGPTALLLERMPEAEHYYWIDPEDGSKKGSLFHQDLPYAGCPDDIAYLNGWLMLVDLKTSKRKYYPQQPEPPHRGIWAEHKKEKAAGLTDGWAHEAVSLYREQFAGWKSFQKCGMQLAAYKNLIKKCLKLDIEKMGVLVACPPDLNNGKAQFLTLTDSQERRFQADWNKRVQDFLLNADIPSLDLKEFL